jgi:hypothetical protein
MEINDVTYNIRGAIFDVYNELGPGLLESYYEKALCVELKSRGLFVEAQVPIEASYKGQIIHDVHKKQLLSYLKQAKKKIGILINFNVARLEDKVSLIRIVN